MWHAEKPAPQKLNAQVMLINRKKGKEKKKKNNKKRNNIKFKMHPILTAACGSRFHRGKRREDGKWGSRINLAAFVLIYSITHVKTDVTPNFWSWRVELLEYNDFTLVPTPEMTVTF